MVYPMSEATQSSTLAVVNVNDDSKLLKVDYLAIKKAAVVLRAINHKLRQQILQLIESNGKMTVTEIYVQLRLEQSVASQHLAILRRAGIVITTREGKFIWYSVSKQRLEEISRFVSDLLN